MGDNGRTSNAGLDSTNCSSARWSSASGFKPTAGEKQSGAAVVVGTWMGSTELAVSSEELEGATVLATVVLAASLDTATVAKGITATDDGAGRCSESSDEMFSTMVRSAPP